MPAKASVKERWKRIDRAFHRGEQLPPVSLYKVGGFYFVLDGHHSLSVASYHGAEWVDAEVTEFGARLSKARRRSDGQPKRGEPNMYQWLPPSSGRTSTSKRCATRNRRLANDALTGQRA
jgi:hypothetical protein